MGETIIFFFFLSKIRPKAAPAKPNRSISYHLDTKENGNLFT